MAPCIEHREVRVTGSVQGVGFRPTVYRLAVECGLNGEVSNDSDGVLIRLSGDRLDIQSFMHRLPEEAPPLARIEAIRSLAVDAGWDYRAFSIGQSLRTRGHTEVPADAATCAACLAELVDSQDRRYGHPFINCTDCGPRLTIIQGRPYDRPRTTMAGFPVCESCANEYADPLDRRFHAQPIACWQCGPRLSVHDGDGHLLAEATSWTRIQETLRMGGILAVKGLGGFHLFCDATHHAAVLRLRQHKQRDAKPLALMAPDLSCIERYCSVSDLERETLRSPEAPIVLLPVRTDGPSGGVAPLSAAIAPGSRLLGFLLPYTPLHHLMCRGFGGPLVATSANLSGEPQITDNSEAMERLAGLVDLSVCHDRHIENRVDDSVVRCISGRMRVLRRARGHAPRPLRLPPGLERADGILAFGAELKSTFCVVTQGMAVLSQHLGDLEDVRTCEDFEKHLALYQSLLDVSPRHLACDMHPDYVSTRLAHRRSDQWAAPVMEVQHHHAHIASVMAEHRIPLDAPPVLGIALDGLGFGDTASDDASLWGGEFLLARYTTFTRLARLAPVALPGGVRAVMEPWRNTVAQLVASIGWQRFRAQYGETSLAGFLDQRPTQALLSMLETGMNCPRASSTGRLFDAVAGALELHAGQLAFEGQAAIELEMLADGAAVAAGAVDGAYPFDVVEATPWLELDARPLWPALLEDLKRGERRDAIATRFHAGLVNAIIRLVDRLAEDHGFTVVALSGGCLQNAVLQGGLEVGLVRRGYRCLTHALVPANDGGIALGQAVIAAARMVSDPMTTV